MNEIQYKRRVMAGLKAKGWHLQEHEDSLQSYIPDVSFGCSGVDGWIEFKYVKKFPTTLAHIDHWTRGQEDWLINRGRSGSGHCYLLLGTPDLHLVWRWQDLSRVRHIPFESAACLATISEGDIPGLCRRLSVVVQRLSGY